MTTYTKTSKKNNKLKKNKKEVWGGGGGVKVKLHKTRPHKTTNQDREDEYPEIFFQEGRKYPGNIVDWQEQYCQHIPHIALENTALEQKNTALIKELKQVKETNEEQKNEPSVIRQSRRKSRTIGRKDKRALSPETEVAHRLRLISERVMQEYGHHFSCNQAVAHLLDVPQEQMTYQLLQDTLQHCYPLDGDLQGWPVVNTLLIFLPKLTFTVLDRGKQGIGRLVDHTTKLIFDRTAGYILQQRGWVSVFVVYLAHNMPGCLEQEGPQDGKKNQDQTDVVKCTNSNEVERLVGNIRQKSETLREDIEPDRFKKHLQKYTMLAIGVALLGVAGLLYRDVKNVAILPDA